MEGEARKPGERRLQILQTLAAMLEEPQPEKITTAALAARIGVSEAALYRHFSSKAQMYEGLIEFIEQSLFGLIARITAETSSPTAQVEAIISMLLSFAAKNPGMTRVLIGEALVHENERLQRRINQLHDRIEAQLRQCLRPGRWPAVRTQRAAGQPVAMRGGRALASVRQERVYTCTGRRCRSADGPPAGRSPCLKRSHPAHRAGWVARHFHHACACLQAVPQQQPADQGLAYRGQEFQCFHRLHRPDHPYQR